VSALATASLLALETAGNAEVSTGEAVAFWVLAPVALGGAIGMVLAKNAVHAALFLVATMLSLGLLYFVQEAPFLGAVQIIVYTGAIMILFLFVLMLIGVDSSDSLVETLRGQRIAAIVLGIGFAGLVAGAIGSALADTDMAGLGESGYAQNLDAIAESLFTDYVFAFEVTSALLITAAMGAMVLAHVERQPGDRRSQREQSIARFREGTPAPLPGPGVYATNDSVAVPALLPDGTEAPGSVTPSLRGAVSVSKGTWTQEQGGAG